MTMSSKIADQHLARQACIYIRQSTMGQVRFNQESTERQYNLTTKAESLGWKPEQIRILDRDLGQSGSATTNREDFKALVGEVAMGRVGAIFSLEASRLARSNQDWHRLLELCAITSTLVIDEDGCYNPAECWRRRESALKRRVPRRSVCAGGRRRGFTAARHADKIVSRPDRLAAKANRC